MKKIDNLEQRFSKTADETPKSSDIIGKLDEISNNLKQTDPTMKKLSDELNTIKNLIEKQPTPDDLLSKINELQQKQKAPLEAARSDSQLEPTHQTSSHVCFLSDEFFPIELIFFLSILRKSTTT